MTRTVTLEDLTHAVGEKLPLAGVPDNATDLRRYQRNLWHRAKVGADPDHWARKYAGTRGLTMDG